MIIMKFGGTSVRDASALQNVANIIVDNLKHKPIIVLSAMAGITNLLEESVQVAVKQQTERVKEVIEKIKNHHISVITKLFKDDASFDDLLNLISTEVHKLEALLNATETIKVKSEDLNHAVLSIGEILSTQIFCALLSEKGLPA